MKKSEATASDFFGICIILLSTLELESRPHDYYDLSDYSEQEDHPRVDTAHEKGEKERDEQSPREK